MGTIRLVNHKVFVFSRDKQNQHEVSAFLRSWLLRSLSNRLVSIEVLV